MSVKHTKCSECGYEKPEYYSDGDGRMIDGRQQQVYVEISGPVGIRCTLLYHDVIEALRHLPPQVSQYLLDYGTLNNLEGVERKKLKDAIDEILIPLRT